MFLLSTDAIAQFSAHLLRWYDHNAADLPWRHTRDPYLIWLSEIMLQQTRIETAIPYYMRFLKSYPDVFALAAAPLDHLLKSWEGLGYYNRARNLHKTAQQVVSKLQGRFPIDAAGLMQLPGIGRYTAGAIASIAYDERVPVLDGNVIRVFSRILDLSEEVNDKAVIDLLWTLADQLVPSARPGDYNQALMELGQTICKSKNPLCADCPVQQLCQSYANGTQSQRPVKRRKAPIPHYDVAAGIIYGPDGRLLIAQRPLEGLLGGLWEFPGGKQESEETLPQCLERELREELAIIVEVGALFVRVKHAFSHFKITLHAYECRYRGPLPPYDSPQALGVHNWVWASLDELERYSFGKADRQVIAALQARQGMLF